MRILTVSNFYDTHGGGLERVAGQLAREFAAAGHHALWAACDADGLPDSPAEPVPLRCANPVERLTGLPLPLPGPVSVMRLWRAVRGADLVVIHDALYAGSVLAMLMAKAARRPAVLIQHIGSIDFASRVLAAVMRLANRIVTRPMMKAANRLVFISATVRDELAPDTRRLPSLLLFNGIDARIFSPDPSADRAALRRAHGLPVSALLVVFVGRFVEKKGLVILHALARLRPDLHIALVGRGPIDPATWGLANVHPLGQLDQPALAQLYRAADALVLPSVGEGFPLVVQEAMACGLPVVTGDVTARADPDATRFLSGVPVTLSDPQGSASRCALVLDRLFANPPDRAAMAAYARTAYDWKAMAMRVIAPLA